MSKKKEEDPYIISELVNLVGGLLLGLYIGITTATDCNCSKKNQATHYVQDTAYTIHLRDDTPYKVTIKTNEVSFSLTDESQAVFQRGVALYEQNKEESK